MTAGRGQRTLVRVFVIMCAAVVLGGCDLLTNADFMRSLRREPGPQDASPITEQALGKLAKGDLIQAASLFDEALKRNPADVHALLGKGMILQRWGQTAQARQAYQAILNQRPGETMRMAVFSDVEPQSVGELASINLAMVSGDDAGLPGGAMPVPAPGTMAPQQSTASATPPGQTPAMSPGTVRTPAGARGAGPQPYLNEGDVNTMARFETLATLRDRGLITPDEFAERRRANIGALLPMTAPAPASTGLDRPPPPADQIIGRLNAIGRALELRAINVRQHSSERGMIVDGLLPAQPRATQNPPLPPKGILEAADHVRRLEALKEKNLITAEEYAKERDTIERTLAPPPPPRPAATPPGPVAVAPPGAAPSGGPRPAVHIASYRSEEAARNGWMQLRRAHQALLGNLQPDIARVNLGSGKGVFFRLMAGPLPSQADADRICRELKARRQFCDTAFMSGGLGGGSGGNGAAPAPGRRG